MLSADGDRIFDDRDRSSSNIAKLVETDTRLLEEVGYLAVMVERINRYTELAIYIGYLRAGWWGLIIAGVCFILPAMAIVWAIAIGYDRFHHLPQSMAIFAGIQPVVAILIVQATWKLGRAALKNIPTAAAGIGSSGLFGFLDISTLIAILVAGFGVMAWQNWRGWRGGLSAIWLPQIEPSIGIAAIAALLIWRWRVDPIWSIFGGAIVGLLGQLARSNY